MKLSYNNIVILTGAGISAESGIATFRSEDGLWEHHAIEDVATPEGFERNPELVQAFYNQRRNELQKDHIVPNSAHTALANLERIPDLKVTVITQNIDDLHERSGSQKVIHMHGELLKMRCCYSGKVFDIKSDISTEDRCSCCTDPQTLRPHIVWFGEIPLQMDEIYSLVSQADLFIAIGTSGVVYPAAGLVKEARFHGAHTIEVNLKPSAVESEFVEQRYGNATVEVPKLIKELLR